MMAKDNPPRSARRSPARYWRRLSPRARRWIAVAALSVALLWAGAPAARAIALVANFGGRAVGSAPSGLPVTNVHFTAMDGTRLAGWYVATSPTAPTVILIHGFKGTRQDMVPWARFLAAAGYNVLLYDSRGCGQSDGWRITLGRGETSDALGAARWARQRAGTPHPRIALLGVSLGAGVAILAAAADPSIAAVIADSAWADETPQLNRMGALRLGPLAAPLLPFEPALVNALIGGDLAAIRPIDLIAAIAPRAVLLIHSRDDQNTLTPLSGEARLDAAAGQPKAQWIAPSGGHAGALAAHPASYQATVLAFLARYLLAVSPSNG